MNITEKQKYAIWVIEEYHDPYGEIKIKFRGNTRKEAIEFIGKYYVDAKYNKLVDDAMFDTLLDPWGNS